MDDDDLLHCFLNFPDVTPDKPFVLDFKSMSEEQENDLVLQHMLQKGTYDKVKTQRVLPMIPETNQMTIVVKINHKSPEDRPRVVMPQTMVDRVIGFYHQILGHGGEQRVHNAISLHFTANMLESRITELISSCDIVNDVNNRTNNMANCQSDKHKKLLGATSLSI